MKRRLAAIAAAAAALIAATAPAAAPTIPSCTYHAYGALPDKTCTPGATNPAVTQATIATTICTPGWTATIRPPVSVTEPEKIAAIQEYGARFGTNLRAYEYDHKIPLELGGSPDSLANLWPEPAAVIHGWGSYDKDVVENKLNHLVCDGKMTLAAAQHIFATDWRRGLKSQP